MRSQSRGVEHARFIVIEGIDGCGKTTVALRLRDALRPLLPRTPFFTREPSDDWFKRAIHAADDHRLRLLLYMADRVVHVRRIRSALRDGHWVICDRYLHSTLVYNPVPVLEGFMTAESFQRLVEWFADGLMPDLTFWLDCPVELALERIRERGLVERMADSKLLEYASERYARVMSAFSDSVVRVDASLPLDRVVAECLEAISSRFRLEVG